MLGPGTVSMDCSFLCYLVVTLKPKCFNSSYCSICIPDNQTGSWPLGPWRSCRAVPHTHGCSGDKPRGGLQSWTLRCPGCCCPHWGSPHPSVLILEGSRPGQGEEEEEGADHAFPILLMTTQLKMNSTTGLIKLVCLYCRNMLIFLQFRLHEQRTQRKKGCGIPFCSKVKSYNKDALCRTGPINAPAMLILAVGFETGNFMAVSYKQSSITM